MTETLTRHAPVVAAVLTLTLAALVTTIAVIALSCVSRDDDPTPAPHPRGQ